MRALPCIATLVLFVLNNPQQIACQGIDRADDYNALLDDILEAVPSTITSFAFIQNDEYVVEWYKSSDPSTLNYVWSVTKSFTSYLFGVMLDRGHLPSVDMTMAEIFGDAADFWDEVDNADDKRTITVKEMLSMTSGYYEEYHFHKNSLVDSFNMDWYPDYRGYMAYTNPILLAYVMRELTGMTPREYAVSTGAFAALGMRESDYEWQQNDDGLETPGYGLSVTTAHMSALGQLYLHNGVSQDTQEQMVSENFVSASSENQVTKGDTLYGYFWWVTPGWSSYSAIGAAGQYITVFPTHQSVFVCTSSDEGASAYLQELFYDIFILGEDYSHDTEYSSYSYSYATDGDDDDVGVATGGARRERGALALAAAFLYLLL